MFESSLKLCYFVNILNDVFWNVAHKFHKIDSFLNVSVYFFFLNSTAGIFVLVIIQKNKTETRIVAYKLSKNDGIELFRLSCFMVTWSTLQTFINSQFLPTQIDSNETKSSCSTTFIYNVHQTTGHFSLFQTITCLDI